MSFRRGAACLLPLLLANVVVVACGDDRSASPATGDAGPSFDANVPDTSVDGAVEAGAEVVTDATPRTIQCAVAPCVLELASAGNSTCARIDDGSVRCWGANEHGQLGRGPIDAGQDDLPAPVAGLVAKVTQLAGGPNGYCVRLEDGSVACWGDNGAGQIHLPGDEVPTSFDTPQKIAGLPKARSAFLGDGLGCATLEGGDAMCWGKANAGRVPALADAGDDPQPPTKIDLGGRAVAAMAVGTTAVAALTDDGTLLSWGKRSRATSWNVNVLGREVALDFALPDALPYPAHAVALVGWGDAASATGGGGAFRWGTIEGSNGPVTPTPVAFANRAKVEWSSLGQGGQFCAVLSDETVRCLGDNAYGQLGTGDYASVPVIPKPTVQLPQAPARVVTSAYHACAILVNGAVMCWGNNTRGQLGAGDFVVHPSPTPVRFTP